MALCIAVVLLALVAFGVWKTPAPESSGRAVSVSAGGVARIGDGFLYQRIIHRVAAGQSYYAAATAEQRAGHYPLRPVFTVRLPTLAVLLAQLPSPASRALWLKGLTCLAILLWGWRVQCDFRSPLLTAWVVFCLILACAFGFYGTSYLFHESWAAVLLLLSLGAYDAARDPLARHARFWLCASLLSAFTAVLIRELAAPFLLVMAAMAVIEKRYREAGLWLAVGGAFTLFMLWHAQMVAGYLLPGDRVSQGWVRFSGWAGALHMLDWNGLLLLAPAAVTGIIVPCMGLGAAGWPGRTGARLFLLCAGYCLGFTVFGRHENSYWGLLVTPLLGLGLGFAPLALIRLGRIMVRKT